MKEVLDKVRLEYRDDYERFIKKMERETDEVRNDLLKNNILISILKLLSCISSLMSARMEKTAAGFHYSSLLELERMRNYQARISGLQADTQNIMDKIRERDNDLDKLSHHYRRERVLVDEELEKLKLKLEKLLQQFTMFARCRLQGSSELEIYNQLLEFEAARVTEEKHEVI